MKKILSLALATIMMLSMATTSFAADISTDGGSQDVTVTYGTNQSFVVTIPANIVMNEEDAMVYGYAEISASNVMIPANKLLTVTIDSENYLNGWYLVDSNEPTNKIRYSVMTSGTEIVSGEKILEVFPGEAYDKTLNIGLECLAEKSTKAGTYQDSLTFTVALENLISFTIDNEYVFYAIEGMDWDTFYNSGLGLGHSFYENESFVYFDDWKLYYSDDERDDYQVHINDIIDPNMHYYTYMP